MIRFKESMKNLKTRAGQTVSPKGRCGQNRRCEKQQYIQKNIKKQIDDAKQKW